MRGEAMRRSIAGVLAAGAVVLLAVAPAEAAPVAPKHWELLHPSGAGEPGKSADPALHRSPDGVLHVAWVHQNGPLDASLLERRLNAGGSLEPTTTTIADHWTNLDDAALLDEGSLLRVFFGGQQGTVFGSPVGLMTATGSTASWSAATRLNPSYGLVSAGGPTGAQSVQVFESNSRVVARAGLTPNVPLTVLTSGIPGVTEGSPNVIYNGQKDLAAWCGFGDNAGGVFVQILNHATAAVDGSPRQMPGSLTTYHGKKYSTCVLQTEVSRRIPLVYSAASRDAYTAVATGYPTLTGVAVWRFGTLSSMTVVSQPARSHSEPALAADPNGRLWVGWIRGGSGAPLLVLRRSNKTATVFGAPVSVPSPASWTIGSFEASAIRKHLDVVAQLFKSGANSLQHTIVLPGLTLEREKVVHKSNGRSRVTYRVLDAGDPVRRAKVTAGSHSGKTATNGRVTLTLRGATHATAKKAGYTSASV